MLGAGRARRGRRAQRHASTRPRPRRQRLVEMTDASGTDWALGVEARSRALLSRWRRRRAPVPGGDRAPRPDPRCASSCARAHLLYGEWLRRERRRGDARAQLRTAHGMFEAMGMAGVRRAGAARTAGHRRDRPHAHPSRHRRRAHRPGGPDRADWPATGCRTPRSAPGCSSAPAPSSTTCARCSPSSASPRAASSNARCPTR